MWVVRREEKEGRVGRGVLWGEGEGGEVGGLLLERVVVERWRVCGGVDGVCGVGCLTVGGSGKAVTARMRKSDGSTILLSSRQNSSSGPTEEGGDGNSSSSSG